ncbi:uncharacterized protein LOC135399558 [Ornithodoros turicata]|uniref:uncharacterized protein LOC135399558 n=1 Tax=Ornithodoros turicata TaxID=34597 RepID=UPI003139BCAD
MRAAILLCVALLIVYQTEARSTMKCPRLWPSTQTRCTYRCRTHITYREKEDDGYPCLTKRLRRGKCLNGKCLSSKAFEAAAATTRTATTTPATITAESCV